MSKQKTPTLQKKRSAEALAAWRQAVELGNEDAATRLSEVE